jgi:hypothetical protein
MSTTLRVVEVFHIANRTIIAVDQDGDPLRSGDHFRSNDGSEFVIHAVAFSSSEAWRSGRRGIEVEVVSGPIITGQKFCRLESSNHTR